VHYCKNCNDPFSVLDDKAILPLNRLKQHQNSTGHNGIRKLKTSVSQLKDKLPQNDESEDDDDDYEWECGECQKAFKTEKALDNHQMATGHRDPTCPVCEKTFGSEKALEQHVSATGHYGSFFGNPIFRPELGQYFAAADQYMTANNIYGGHRILPQERGMRGGIEQQSQPVSFFPTPAPIPTPASPSTAVFNMNACLEIIDKVLLGHKH
jgi:uncharacterized C2H2 Zn-finger protein